MIRRVIAAGAVCTVSVCMALVSGCASGQGGDAGADIGKVSQLKADFGPEFEVTEVAPTGIDPAVLAGQRIPDGMAFDPAGCAQFAAGRSVPPGTEGNMAAVSAEGEGNRFVVIAVQTSAAIPVIEPGSDCRKVSFAGGATRGTVEVVDAPRIEGAETFGVHRVVQTVVAGTPRAGEVYSYSAHFGDFQVIVSANPLVTPDEPPVPVDTERARDLLVAGVQAVRG
jgi:hypothetical protein